MVWVMSEHSSYQGGAGPAPNSAERRALLGQAHRLKAHMAVGRKGLSETFAQQVREAFGKGCLLKVRLDADDAAGAEELADALARLVGCHLLRRIGRVAILYRKPAEPGP